MSYNNEWKYEERTQNYACLYLESNRNRYGY